MRKPLTIAKTMPTILRLELDEVVVVLSARTNIADIGRRVEAVGKRPRMWKCQGSSLSLVATVESVSSPIPDGLGLIGAGRGWFGTELWMMV